VSLLAQPKVAHTFRLRNTAAAPVTIRSAVSACGCIGTVAGGVVAPGGTTEVRVELDLAKVPAGTLRKQIEVIGDNGTVLATLEMVGTLAPAAVFDPPILDFGRIESGRGKAQEVTVALDARAISGGKPWPSPGVVAPDGSSPASLRVTPLPEAAREATDAAGVRRLRRRYRVEVGEGAPVGVVSGTLTFPAPDAGPALRAAVAFVSAEVYGDITCSPQLIAFAGSEEIRRVELRAADPAVFSGLKVRSASPHLTARLAAPDPASAGVRTLEVTLESGAPATLTESSVELTTANGQRVVLPVRVYRTAFAP